MQKDSSSEKSLLSNFPFRDIVAETLQLIIDLFEDTTRIREKYGCVAATQEDLARLLTDGNTSSNPLRHLASSFSNFKVAARGSKLTKAGVWIIQDRKKFGVLIQEIKDLIDGVTDITKGLSSVREQEESMQIRIGRIRDIPTLKLVSDVCSDQYPVTAETASVAMADTVSIDTKQYRDIANWVDDVDSENLKCASVFAAVDDLDITEMKRRLIAYMVADQIQRNQQKGSMGSPPLSLPNTFEQLNLSESSIVHDPRSKVKGIAESTFEVEKLADGLQKLCEDDLLVVVQMIHDNKTANTYVRNDVENGVFQVDLYTLPHHLIRKLWDFTRAKVIL